MNTKKDNTEEKILEAATSVFVKKGLDGARMQEIADKAGINKALLHYYFRSKDRLFEAIFSEIIKVAFPEISRILQSDIKIVEKIDLIVDAYLALLIKHPFMPGFVLRELNRDPSGLFKLILKFGFKPDSLLEPINAAMERGEIIKMPPVHLISNVISLIVFPFAARPIVNYIFFKDDKKLLDEYYSQRAAIIKQFVKNAIVINR